MGNTRAWIFRVLVLAAGGLWLWAWFSPWWMVTILQLGKDVAVIRPWGLILDNVPKEYLNLVRNASMPDWFAPAMWAFLGLTVLAMLYAIIFRDRDIRLIGKKFNLNQLLLGLDGFSIVVFVVVFVIVATVRAAEFWDTPLQGTYFIKVSESEYSDVVAQLLSGFYLATVAGPFFLILALLRNKIVGKTKLA